MNQVDQTPMDVQRMIQTVKIQCPRCQGISQLYLSSAIPIVILNCPMCWTPVLHHQGCVHELSENQLRQIMTKRITAIRDILETIAAPSPQPHATVASAGNSNCNQISIRCAPTPSLYPSGRLTITNDDIVDLRIDLATIGDAQEFINRL